MSRGSILSLTKFGLIPVLPSSEVPSFIIILPPKHKPEGIDCVKLHHSLIFRSLVKVVFMGAINRPILEIGFDKSILLKSISDKKVWKKTSYNQHFLGDTFLDAEITGIFGRWRNRFYKSTLTFSEMYKQLANNYNLEGFLSFCIMLTYESYGEMERPLGQG